MQSPAKTTFRGKTLAIVLAAGEGTRMKSSRTKVLHEVGGRSMLGHVLGAVRMAGVSKTVVIVGPGREDVAAEARLVLADAEIAVQNDRLGTAHAVLHARRALEEKPDAVIVLFGDTPLVSAATISRLLEAIALDTGAAALGFEAADPTGYGRLVMDGDTLVAIREHKDASEAERRITFCNGGLMALNGARAIEILDAIGNDNAQKEYYLPDAIEIARQKGLKTAALKADASEVLGVNDRVQLAEAEAIFQNFERERHMRAGVTMRAPETVFFSYDTELAADVVLFPHVVFGPDVVVEEGATIQAYSHLEGVKVGAGASVGPFARLRPGTTLGAGAKIGNFVEVKASDVGPGAKISHLSYIGDSTLGAEANIGAGTITCNYDGFDKFRTVIGENAFIGSNSALVAPVTIGAGAYIGSGSVITGDVADDALAIARGRQVEKPGWGKAFRDRHVGKPKQKP